MGLPYDDPSDADHCIPVEMLMYQIKLIAIRESREKEPYQIPHNFQLSIEFLYPLANL
jgi:hypothetical protein